MWVPAARSTCNNHRGGRPRFGDLRGSTMAKVTEVLMPLMGEGVHEATLTNWLIKEGSPVTKDSPLLEVSTDKVDTEIPAPASGILVKVLVPVGTIVKVDQALALISSDAGAAVDIPASAP